MKALLLAIAVLVCAPPAAAHQLDEYLQATRIAIEPDRIVLEIGLTPGVTVAERIFTAIDRNSDTRVSESEVGTYGRQVLQDLALEIDGHRLPLALVRAESPAWSELRDGVGTIRLRVAAEGRVPRGHHQLRFVNSHLPEISVYLVNVLMPSTSAISIREQQRDLGQHGIRLEFDRGVTYPRGGWILFPLVGAAVLVVYRRRETGGVGLQPDPVRLKADNYRGIS
jgi:hypothetical protein